MNRRDLLKLFGVGAAAVPLIGGVPRMEAAARLVEPANVEPVLHVGELAFGDLPDALLLITVYNRQRGVAHQFEADELRLELSPREYRSVNDAFRWPSATAWAPRKARFVLSGHIAETATGELFQVATGVGWAG